MGVSPAPFLSPLLSHTSARCLGTLEALADANCICLRLSKTECWEYFTPMPCYLHLLPVCCQMKCNVISVFRTVLCLDSSYLVKCLLSLSLALSSIPVFHTLLVLARRNALDDGWAHRSWVLSEVGHVLWNLLLLKILLCLNLVPRSVLCTTYLFVPGFH